jgi:hypothetical protein
VWGVPEAAGGDLVVVRVPTVGTVWFYNILGAVHIIADVEGPSSGLAPAASQTWAQRGFVRTIWARRPSKGS